MRVIPGKHNFTGGNGYLSHRQHHDIDSPRIIMNFNQDELGPGKHHLFFRYKPNTQPMTLKTIIKVAKLLRFRETYDVL